MILGIDVSTSICGFSVVANNQILYYNHIDLRKHKGVIKKAQVLKDKIDDLFEAYQCDGEHAKFGFADYPIEHIYIEQPFTFFNSGGSSAKTMAILQKFNGVVSWIVYEMFDIEPQYVTAMEARKLCGIKVPRGHKAKQVVLEHLLDTEPAFSIEYTSHGNPKPESYDRADAIVIAKAGCLIEDEKRRSSNIQE
jgi:Holliday junction resolvasome RuvABC endonuclease subunit|tara:strand:- start:970 stop:1551 length:582 start_codon:yes stop_codon:yes gene_type:complete